VQSVCIGYLPRVNFRSLFCAIRQYNSESNKLRYAATKALRTGIIIEGTTGAAAEWQMGRLGLIDGGHVVGCVSDLTGERKRSRQPSVELQKWQKYYVSRYIKYISMGWWDLITKWRSSNIVISSHSPPTPPQHELKQGQFSLNCNNCVFSAKIWCLFHTEPEYKGFQIHYPGKRPLRQYLYHDRYFDSIKR